MHRICSSVHDLVRPENEIKGIVVIAPLVGRHGLATDQEFGLFGSLFAAQGLAGVRITCRVRVKVRIRVEVKVGVRC